MPRGFMDDLEGEVIDKEVHEGGFENRLGTRPQGFESLSLRHSRPQLKCCGHFTYWSKHEHF